MLDGLRARVAGSAALGRIEATEARFREEAYKHAADTLRQAVAIAARRPIALDGGVDALARAWRRPLPEDRDFPQRVRGRADRDPGIDSAPGRTPGWSIGESASPRAERTTGLPSHSSRVLCRMAGLRSV